MPHLTRPAIAIALLVAAQGFTLRAADRQVAWVVADGDRGTERALNAEAARGLRLATVTEGLPCSVAIMQTPETPGGGATYRVIADRDLPAALPQLAAEGFEPRGMMRRTVGRAHVVWERVAQERQRTAPGDWRIVEFANPDTLEADLAVVARDGFRPVLLARNAFRSWPGLSEKGQILVVKRPNSAPRDVRVLAGRGRKLDDIAKEFASLTAAGWEFDLLITTSRDGSREARRERAYVVLSRDPARKSPPVPMTLERSSSWGTYGSGVAVAATNYWHEFLLAIRREEGHQIWGTPTRIKGAEPGCTSLGLTLELDAGRTQRSTIVGAVGRFQEGLGDYELVVMLDERFGR